MIKKGYSVEEVRAGVLKWFSFVNPSGFSGKGCYIGNCEKPFNKDGCGGMDPKRLRW
jgi:hypothetical protein